MFSDPNSPQIQIIYWMLKRGGTVSYRKFKVKCGQLQVDSQMIYDLLHDNGILTKLDARGEDVVKIVDLAIAGRILAELNMRPPHHSGRFGL